MTNVALRFTGKRTGLEGMVVPRVGRVAQGDVFEVDAESAARYLTPRATAGGTLESDFEVAEVVVEDEPAQEPVTAPAPRRRSSRSEQSDMGPVPEETPAEPPAEGGI